ncbi:uncharacterized protein LAESUDRAFT_729829 [Laetiporus sulphureus 93-53]|uniref:Uncharacterized protein n=1 Tax=Laetiporus sulphureus 93-53 TaxID=1314785 RepID=A0A165CHZ3_9APHY|nr:uncharacterized protein LAESUDRAFT_729829 [Laetiporus sulphureus 93-53]KZT02853.1 hypothetical protein LAESUDRAFT_729829 [Laetiporus sulphureus 93-53]
MALALSLTEPELVAMAVEQSVHFPLLGDESDPIWAGITSSGGGYIHMGPDNRLFMITVFHELHCLRVLNLAYAGSLDAPAEHIDHCDENPGRTGCGTGVEKCG